MNSPLLVGPKTRTEQPLLLSRAHRPWSIRSLLTEPDHLIHTAVSQFMYHSSYCPPPAYFHNTIFSNQILKRVNYSSENKSSLNRITILFLFLVFVIIVYERMNSYLMARKADLGVRFSQPYSKTSLIFVCVLRNIFNQPQQLRNTKVSLRKHSSILQK